MTEDPRHEPPGPGGHVGSLAEEAARLFGALSDAARAHGLDLGAGATGLGSTNLGDRAASAIHDLDDHVATGAEECRLCPVCRALALMRRTSPDVSDHLADAARSLSRAVAAMLATDTVGGRRTRSAGGAETDGGVDHIDLTDGSDWLDLNLDPDDSELEDDA